MERVKDPSTAERAQANVERLRCGDATRAKFLLGSLRYTLLTHGGRILPPTGSDWNLRALPASLVERKSELQQFFFPSPLALAEQTSPVKSQLSRH
ncbi:hypothetical protein AnigIFM60653_000323 [Aspergillus niger]|uniref:Uncharacterized protein n=2 Tax=Aspergillus niger TaxID=5061 RepID=A2QE86_ASPNC|nr:uncharacterized protein BO96DRAFT_324726 [Aspergillus niger CBS 101883]XP_059600069.1 hypothetical protein An02g09795 [Aspergillus niger]PYH61716.1 hypothetical protein BO96DRAFT_324726 [Aspergillus niger CBS 101883]CAK37847.1 hypothetical protein An02g09795 [Aspergillus niger]GJP91641.1 uncharacterized protein AlacWU_04540 [Aspergillus niger]GKZ54745.1 hypothetical protein AnigIFM49718_010564 [Aspergillus niger]GKZ63848.1 hypothetical protein AnigIFM50267_000134 [Aspergillus niger]